MSDQAHTTAYVAAFDAANADLERLFEEATQLRNRMDQVNSAIEALKPLLDGSDTVSAQEWNSTSSPANQQVHEGLDLVLA